MKNKISFTSVLKSKESRQLNLSSQYSNQSQHRHQKLVDIYQQFQSYPEQDYTLDFNAFRTMAHRSRNSSVNMAKSKKVNEDPELDLQSWVERQKRQNYESFTRGNNTQKSFKQTLSAQQDMSLGRRSKSNYNRNQNYPEQDEIQEETNYYPSNNIGKNKGYDQSYLEESNRYSQKEIKKSPVNYRSQNAQLFEQKTLKARQPLEESIKMTPHEYLAAQQLKSKSYYPELEDQDYDRLKQEFEKMKNQKIAEMCMQTKKSIKKDKLQQIICQTLENIYEDIQEMAQQMKMTKKNSYQDANKKISQQEVSEQMLISGSHAYHEESALSRSQEEINRLEDERRKEQMKNMIKGYISGIQEAKSHGRSSSAFQQVQSVQNNSLNYQQGKYSLKNSETFEEQEQEPSFNHNNTYNNEVNYENTFNNQIHNKAVEMQGEKNESKTKCLVPVDSVGYSFSNNIICEHSFSRQLANNNNHFQNNDNEFHFQKNVVQPPIYEPQNSDNQDQQRISLPNIQEVKSDCGDFHNEHMEVESSDEIEYKRNKMQNLTLDITGNNIKNIESVHYQPPVSQSKLSGYFEFNAHYNSKGMFKNFQQSSQSSIASGNNTESQNSIRNGNEEMRNDYDNEDMRNNDEEMIMEKEEIGREQNIHQEQRFVSKTFNSYLSGEMRSEYGQAIKEIPVETKEVYSSIRNSGFGYKISPIAKYSPSNQQAKQYLVSGSFSKINQQSGSLNNSAGEKAPVHQVSTPKQQVIFTTNSITRNNEVHFSRGNLNESPNLSFNQSFNQNHSNWESALSPKNVHQLQSKNKFSISSPMAKIDEIISQQKILGNSQTQINQFGLTDKQQTYSTQEQTYSRQQNYSNTNTNSRKQQSYSNTNTNSKKQQSYNNIGKNNGSNSYAISSPVGDYKISQSFEQKVMKQNSEKITDSKYACAQSIISHHHIQTSLQGNNRISSNSILSMQPLKISSVNQVAGKQSFVSNKMQGKVSGYINHRVTQSVLNDEVYADIPKPKSSTYSIHQSPNFNSGRNFLLSLHQKQSIELDPSSNEKSSVLESKQSFAAETFRPHPQNQSYVKESIKFTNTNENTHSNTYLNTHSNSNKISITKITLRSSDKNQVSSPKLVSLTVNSLHKNQLIKQFTLNPTVDGKQNIFQKLTIRDSRVEQNPLYQSKSSVSNNMQHSIKNSQSCGVSKLQNHTDFSSKQNSNTLNNSIKLNDWKNQSVKFDTKTNQENEKESVTAASKPLVVQKKEPLLKLSKNLGNSIRQVENKMNVKKSIGQSIRGKVHLPSSMGGSKMISIGGRQSFKAVKQSIGNDSDMDFDLELD